MHCFNAVFRAFSSDKPCCSNTQHSPAAVNVQTRCRDATCASSRSITTYTCSLTGTRSTSTHTDMCTGFEARGFAPENGTGRDHPCRSYRLRGEIDAVIVCVPIGGLSTATLRPKRVSGHRAGLDDRSIGNRHARTRPYPKPPIGATAERAQTTKPRA